MFRLKAEEGSFMIIATIVVKFKSIVRTLKYFKGWTFSNAGPFSAIVVFSPIDYVLKGRSHDFYKKYYLEIESNSFAFLFRCGQSSSTVVPNNQHVQQQNLLVCKLVELLENVCMIVKKYSLTH